MFRPAVWSPQQYARWWGAAENTAYYDMLKERCKTQIKVAKPAARGDGLVVTQ